MPSVNKQSASAAKTKLYGLDHLRAFAISFVFLYHYTIIFPHPPWLESLASFGWTGVDLFFVLSGYLIASQLLAEAESERKLALKPFFLKRFFRIIPAYLVMVALYFCLPFAREREALAPLWKYLTFTQNIGLNLRTQGTFSHAWSLCIEEQFYLLLPLILLALLSLRRLKLGGVLLIFLFLSGFVVRYYSYQHFVAPFEDDDTVWVRWYKAIYYPTWCRLDGLLTGVGIAALLQFKPKFAAAVMKYGNWILLLGLCVLSGAYFLCLDQNSFAASVFGFPLVSLGYGLMVFGAISPSSFLYTTKSKATTTVAVLSYAVYLLHKMVIHLTQTGFEKWHIAKDSNLIFFLCVITCLFAAFVLNRLVERPFLKWRNKLLTNPKA